LGDFDGSQIGQWVPPWENSYQSEREEWTSLKPRVISKDAIAGCIAPVLTAASRFAAPSSSKEASI
jgi:hypothetical protein